MTTSTPPLVYHYDPETGIYVGTSELAVQSPLDAPGIWIFPAHSTTVTPPSIPEGHQATFANGVWSLPEIPATPTLVQPAAPAAG